MCLLKTHDEPKIAQNDIEVWKVLTSAGLSTFRNYPYHPGLNKPAKQRVIPVKQQYVEDGYLHAYRNKADAENLLKYYSIIQSRCQNYQAARVPLNGTAIDTETFARMYHVSQRMLISNHMVQRMLIPKGTAYYEGDDGDICAECLYWPEEGEVGTVAL